MVHKVNGIEYVAVFGTAEKWWTQLTHCWVLLWLDIGWYSLRVIGLFHYYVAICDATKIILTNGDEYGARNQ